MYLVYLLKCNNCTYIGMTNDFLRRWRQHIGDLKGGAKYTTRKGRNWYPICIIDGFKTMKEAMQCEWSLKHYMKKKFKGPKGRIQRLTALLERGIWTSKSPIIKEQELTIYIDDEYKHLLSCNTRELYWKY